MLVIPSTLDKVDSVGTCVENVGNADNLLKFSIILIVFINDRNDKVDSMEIVLEMLRIFIIWIVLFRVCRALFRAYSVCGMLQ